MASIRGVNVYKKRVIKLNLNLNNFSGLSKYIDFYAYFITLFKEIKTIL